ncbi:MAG: hypothetical protein NC388_00015 [Clostridium sp.]|nr:hypothetical protein [Clostridium sp.]
MVTAKGVCPAGSFFLIQQRGRVLASAPADRAQGFSPEWFSDGIAQILLVSAEARVLSERLVFLHAGKTHSVEVSRDKVAYAPREAVRLSLSGLGARGSVALSVTDSGSDPSDGRTGIAAQLLLQGELKGRVDHPAFYLAEGHLHELDLLMLTHGWRRYDLPAVLSGNITLPQQPLEQGQQLCGTVRSLWRNQPQAGVNVSALSPGRSIKAMGQTDGEGRFALDVPDFPEGTSFVLQALRNDGKPEYNVTFEEYPPSAAAYVEGRFLSSGERGRKSMIDPEYQRIAFNPSQREMLLPEVVVTERKGASAMENLLNIMARRTFDADYLKDNHVTHIDEVLRKIAGMQIREEKLIYRANEVAIMIDGVIMENPLANKATFANFDDSQTKKKSMHRVRVQQPGVLLTTPFTDLKESLPMSLIKRIDFIPSYMAVVFGPKGTGGGILSVTTKRGDDLVNDNVPLPIQVINPLGTQTPDENGRAVVPFHMPDNVPAGWNIVVEGLAEDGSVIELSR